MNGIGLLVLLAVSGQVGLPQSPPFAAQTTSQPPADPQVDSGRNFGWEFDPRDHALCYIVQITPQQARDMQVPGVESPLEFPSDMPAELVGRATRILFRIGTEVLPRTPSLAEIDKMPRFNARSDIASALEPGGKFRDLEDAVVNVQNDNRMPSFPQSLGGATTAPPATTDPRRGGNLVDQARAGLSDLPSNDPSRPAEQFLSGAAGGRTPALPQTPAGGTPAPLAGSLTLPSTGGGQSPYTAADKYQSATEPPPPNAGGGNTGIPNGWGAVSDDRNRGPSGQNSSGQASTGQSGNASGSPDYGNAANQGYGYGSQPGGYTEGPYDPRSLGAGTPPFNAIPGQRTPVDGFGNYPGGRDAYAEYAASQSRPSYGSESDWRDYQAGRNGQSPPGRSPADTADPSVRLAANTTSGAVLPETSGANATKGNPSNGPPSGPPSSPSGNTETILQFFFLLSLVVNFYLGMLIRKLLTRYRSLLSSVRGQTA